MRRFLTRSIRSARVRRTGATVLGLLAVALALRLWPHASLSESAPTSTALLARDGRLLRLTLAADQQYRLWVPLEEISPTLVEAVQLKEDRWFHWHPGVNPAALVRSAWATYVGGHQQGGSTLTMQLARRRYGMDTRSPWGKARQVAAAIWLELRYSKHDILEAYLNLVPMGGNVEGVGAASLIYFGKPAQRLALPEALTLAVMPQAPGRRGDFGPALRKARDRLAADWRGTQVVDPLDERLLHLALPNRARQALPFRAPHLSDALLAEGAAGTVKTTLDLKLQTLLERQVNRYVAQNGARGIHNAVAMLVDTRDQSVRALVGSADYFNRDIDGQVNGTQGKRSPGSTLKPFLYGLALDQGLIHPLSILKDAPTAFGPFQPENFDGHFQGPLTATDALVKSRNVPAVQLASRLKRPSLYDFLKSAGVSQMQSESHYGLALTLGGGEVTMEELATLYTLLADDGVLRPLRYREDAPKGDGVRLLSKEASFLVLDMLRQNPRPDGLLQAMRGRRWTTAWKTGTSWGFRDAWTAGVVGPYVLVVWIGNFDGAGNPAFVGIDAAAPLFFRIADALPLALPQEIEPVRLPPKGLRRVKVCTASGDLPNAWCPQTSETWFIPGKSPIKVSTLHRPVVVDNRSGRPACPPYDPATTHTEVFEFWSSDLLRLFREAGMPRRTPPAPDSACNGGGEIDGGDAPRLTSPLTQVTYTLRTSKPDETIALQASAAADARELYWFVDRAYLGRSLASEGGLPWRPDGGGWHTISVVDDRGRSASRDVKLEFAP